MIVEKLSFFDVVVQEPADKHHQPLNILHKTVEKAFTPDQQVLLLPDKTATTAQAHNTSANEVITKHVYLREAGQESSRFFVTTHARSGQGIEQRSEVPAHTQGTETIILGDATETKAPPITETELPTAPTVTAPSKEIRHRPEAELQALFERDKPHLDHLARPVTRAEMIAFLQNPESDAAQHFRKSMESFAAIDWHVAEELRHVLLDIEEKVPFIQAINTFSPEQITEIITACDAKHKTELKSYFQPISGGVTREERDAVENLSLEELKAKAIKNDIQKVQEGKGEETFVYKILMGFTGPVSFFQITSLMDVRLDTLVNEIMEHPHDLLSLTNGPTTLNDALFIMGVAHDVTQVTYEVPAHLEDQARRNLTRDYFDSQPLGGMGMLAFLNTPNISSTPAEIKQLVTKNISDALSGLINKVNQTLPLSPGTHTVTLEADPALQKLIEVFKTTPYFGEFQKRLLESERISQQIAAYRHAIASALHLTLMSLEDVVSEEFEPLNLKESRVAVQQIKSYLTQKNHPWRAFVIKALKLGRDDVPLTQSGTFKDTVINQIQQKLILEVHIDDNLDRTRQLYEDSEFLEGYLSHRAPLKRYMEVIKDLPPEEFLKKLHDPVLQQKMREALGTSIEDVKKSLQEGGFLDLLHQGMSTEAHIKAIQPLIEQVLKTENLSSIIRQKGFEHVFGWFEKYLAVPELAEKLTFLLDKPQSPTLQYVQWFEKLFQINPTAIVSRLSSSRQFDSPWIQFAMIDFMLTALLDKTAKNITEKIWGILISIAHQYPHQFREFWKNERVSRFMGSIPYDDIRLSKLLIKPDAPQALTKAEYGQAGLEQFYLQKQRLHLIEALDASVRALPPDEARLSSEEDTYLTTLKRSLGVPPLDTLQESKHWYEYSPALISSSNQHQRAHLADLRIVFDRFNEAPSSPETVLYQTLPDLMYKTQLKVLEVVQFVLRLHKDQPSFENVKSLLRALSVLDSLEPFVYKKSAHQSNDWIAAQLENFNGVYRANVQRIKEKVSEIRAEFGENR